MSRHHQTTALAAVLGLALSGCAVDSTPVTQDFSTAQKLRVGVGLVNETGGGGLPTGRRNLTAVISYLGGPDECVLASNVVATLNGAPLHRDSEGFPVNVIDTTEFGGCAGTTFSTSQDPALVAPLPVGSDDQARTGVLVFTDGTRTVRVEIPSLLDERLYTVAGPDDSVLVPGAPAVIAWSNQSGLDDFKGGETLWIDLVNGWDDVEHRAKAPAVTLTNSDVVVGENRVAFTVPPLVAGKGFVALDANIPLAVSRCDGAESCEAEVRLRSLWKEITVELR